MFYDWGLGQRPRCPVVLAELRRWIVYPECPCRLRTSPPIFRQYRSRPHIQIRSTRFLPNLELPARINGMWRSKNHSAANKTLSVTYVGQAGRDLLRQAAIYQPNRNFEGLFYFTKNDAFSNYNALQVQYPRPLRGVSKPC